MAITPDGITPDEKDWTWVVHERCPECGYDATALHHEQVAPAIRANAAAWQHVLASNPDVRRRPAVDRWSPLEYACHVRDVLRIYDYRLGLILSEDDPTYPNWDQDETALAERYHEQDPTVVAGELHAAAAQIASRFESVREDQWSRTGNRSDGARFTIDTVARYLLHDPVHHVWDVRQGYAALTGSA